MTVVKAPPVATPKAVRAGTRIVISDILKGVYDLDKLRQYTVSPDLKDKGGQNMALYVPKQFVVDPTKSSHTYIQFVDMEGRIGGYHCSLTNPPVMVVNKKDVGAAAAMTNFEMGAKAAHLRDNRLKRHIGADPEVFAVDKDGMVIPAFQFLPEKNPKLNNPYWDGFQAEFTISAETCLAFVVDSIRSGLYKTQAALKGMFPKATITPLNTFNIPFNLLVESDAKYVNFGCKPSFSAYDDVVAIPDGNTVSFRSAGGHLHFSYKKNPELIVAAVKRLDAVLGVIAVSLFQAYDDPRRRMYYGRAGEYRTPPHGLEYRVLSNAWMIAPFTTHLVYEIARVCIGDYIDRNCLTGWQASEEEVRNCINNCDVALAHKILKRNDELLSIIMWSLPIECGNRVKYVEAMKKIVFDGIHEHLYDPDSFSSRWRIDGDKDGLYWLGHSEGAGCNLSSTAHQVLSNQKVG